MAQFSRFDGMVHRVTNSAKNQQLRSPKPQPPRSNSKDPRLTPGVFLVIRTKAGHPLSKNTAKQNRADAPAYENRPYFFLIRSGFSPIGPAGAPNAHRAILLFSAAGTAARPTARSRPKAASGTASAHHDASWERAKYGRRRRISGAVRLLQIRCLLSPITGPRPYIRSVRRPQPSAPHGGHPHTAWDSNHRRCRR